MKRNAYEVKKELKMIDNDKKKVILLCLAELKE
jgi:hypothetical protein